MKLYYHPHACSMAVHIALRESGLSFDIESVAFPTKITNTGEDFIKVNPKGMVPALLLDSGEVLTEVTTILSYVADLVPNKKLIPESGTMYRYRLTSFLSSISMDLHKNFSAFFFPVEIKAWREVSKTKLDNAFAYFNSLLDDGEYIMGDGYSIADIYLFVMLHWCDYFSMPIDQWPNLERFKAAIISRPAVQSTLKIELGH
ncbi:glutathione S-transferase [Serratia marcescens]|nr:glutathione S-transferase [Serratia marcescens]BEM76927.1 glutathione S-transferase [Serratia marcescens]